MYTYIYLFIIRVWNLSENIYEMVNIILVSDKIIKYVHK